MNHFKTTTVSYNYFTVYLCISVDGMLKNMGKIALFFSRKKVEICCLCFYSVWHITAELVTCGQKLNTAQHQSPIYILEFVSVKF